MEKNMLEHYPDYSLLGLDSRDIRVYEALYQLDKGSLRAIAQYTGLNRGTVHETIKKLTNMGLVSFTPSGSRRHYVAARPEIFLALIRERRDQLQQLEVPTTEYVKRLEIQKKPDTTTYSAQFYEGDEGIASILRDVLQTVQDLDDKVYSVISSQRASNFIYNNFKSFSRQRTKLNIFVRVISDVHSSEKLVLAERRQLRTTQKTLNGYIIVYGNRTALISISDTNQLSGIIIDDLGTANMHRLIFEQLWLSASVDI